eukprot:gnl/TRDRNA2_/TRDRNA2_210759_c0_seq1.p2 gnl/TRDRNA2_/TRDRNA2_210759_c0~~gnl/TRDRNA2_/TRDRNA2_210759_c0_seq1.p2  ORF type:complete len:123 (+),score=2.55 gnl/TRDRNA2_/TRDRNA2_210759_c0_seq1:67-435(+)
MDIHVCAGRHLVWYAKRERAVSSHQMSQLMGTVPPSLAAPLCPIFIRVGVAREPGLLLLLFVKRMKHAMLVPKRASSRNALDYKFRPLLSVKTWQIWRLWALQLGGLISAHSADAGHQHKPL